MGKGVVAKQVRNLICVESLGSKELKSVKHIILE